MINISDNEAVALIETIQQNADNVKAGICDAFANVVLLGEQNPETWHVLNTLQEYTHLLNTLAESRTLSVKK